MLFKAVEIAVVMQEQMAMLNAEGSDQTVNCLSNRYAACPEIVVISRRLDGETHARTVEYGQVDQLPVNSAEIIPLHESLAAPGKGSVGR